MRLGCGSSSEFMADDLTLTHEFDLTFIRPSKLSVAISHASRAEVAGKDHYFRDVGVRVDEDGTLSTHLRLGGIVCEGVVRSTSRGASRTPRRPGTRGCTSSGSACRGRALIMS